MRKVLVYGEDRERGDVRAVLDIVRQQVPEIPLEGRGEKKDGKKRRVREQNFIENEEGKGGERDPGSSFSVGRAYIAQLALL